MVAGTDRITQIFQYLQDDSNTRSISFPEPVVTPPARGDLEGSSGS